MVRAKAAAALQEVETEAKAAGADCPEDGLYSREKASEPRSRQ